MSVSKPDQDPDHGQETHFTICPPFDSRDPQKQDSLKEATAILEAWSIPFQIRYERDDGRLMNLWIAETRRHTFRLIRPLFLAFTSRSAADYERATKCLRQWGIAFQLRPGTKEIWLRRDQNQIEEVQRKLQEMFGVN